MSSKEKEIDLLKKDFQELENKQQAYKKADAEYKEKIIALNTKLSNHRSEYEQIRTASTRIWPTYFMAMNSKDAADLMSRLDETR